MLIIVLTTLFSGALVSGLFQVAKGARFHELNSLHLHYIVELNTFLRDFQVLRPHTETLRDTIIDIRNQPVSCLELIDDFDRFIMERIGTAHAITLCERDIEIAQQSMAALARFDRGELTEPRIREVLTSAAARFRTDSAEFQPLIGETVRFILRTTIVAFLVLSGMLILATFTLARGISRAVHIMDDALDALKRGENRKAEFNDAMSGMIRRQSDSVASIGNVIRQVTEHVAKTIAIDRVSVWTFEDDDSTQRCLDHFDSSQGLHTSDPTPTRRDVTTYLAALKKDRILAIEDIASDPHLSDERREELTRDGIVSILDSPIIVEGIEIGVLSLQHRGVARSWALDEQSFCMAASDILALALEGDAKRQAKAEAELNAKKLGSVIDHVYDGVIMIDQHGVINLFNAASERLFGIDVDEAIGTNIKNLIPEVATAHHDAHDGSDLVMGPEKNSDIDRDVVALKRDGTRFPAHLSISEVANPEWIGGAGSASQSFIGTIHDLTQRKQEEEHSRQVQKMDAMGKLTGGIAHDFNNLLAVILGFSSLLKIQVNDDPKLSQHAIEIYKAAERGRLLIQKLLAFAQKKDIDFVMVNINEALREDRMLLDKSLTARIDLRLELFDHLWMTRLDRGELQNVVLNMSINAAHAMPEGGMLTLATANIVLSEVDARSLNVSAGDYVRLSIIDDGIGMDQATVANIFDPFFTTKGTLGTGLGLSQAYGFVKGSGGAIKVRSEPGQGTCFSLFFPRRAGVTLATSSVSSDPSSPDIRDQASSCTESILVVDDEPSLRTLASHILEPLGYQIFLAEGVEEAIELLAAHSVDLIVSDVIMPGRGGFELAAIARDEYPDIKVLLTSGFSDYQGKSQMDFELDNSRLSKPYTPAQLIEAVKATLAR